MNTHKTEIKLLSLQHLKHIIALEEAVWPQHMAASHETLCLRFVMGHHMLGAWLNGELVGLASWRLAWLDLQNREAFPSTFSEFANQENASPHNAAFVYNLGIHPAHRGKDTTHLLVNAVLAYAQKQSCEYVVGDGRCPSYQGSALEQIEYRPTFKVQLDRALLNQQALELNWCLLDPTLSFYYRLLKCEFLWVMPNFIPSDIASGGHRVIFYKKLISSL